ncbi:MAG TPA: lipoprotein insertase outer membrane protein LolB [Rhodanobacteraceae bacterium]|nr:lipoprotein insertase outer membrane protein LolB [Rhodanobacteraceae bacterium]
MRGSRCVRAAAVLALLTLLAACAPTVIRSDKALLAAQDAREARLAGQDHWQLGGKLGVSDGHDGGSGQLRWSEDGERSQFVLSAPVTGRSFRLQVDASGAQLDGLDQGPLHGPDAESLLRRALGWEVPVAALRYWARGLRAPGEPARIAFGSDGLPARIEQAGWTVEYRDWYADAKPPLPRKVYAERAPYRVRLSIQRWDTP